MRDRETERNKEKIRNRSFTNFKCELFDVNIYLYNVMRNVSLRIRKLQFLRKHIGKFHLIKLTELKSF